MDLMAQHIPIWSPIDQIKSVAQINTIPASACIGLICTHTLKINPTSPCLFSSSSVSTTVYVFATNVLGNGPGPESNPVVFAIPECDGNRINIPMSYIISWLTLILGL